MSNMNPVNLTAGPPETVLPPEPDDALAALDAALGLAPEAQRAAVGEAVCANPTFLAGWATLGDLARADGDRAGAYSAYRVGYHRGLDRLRQNGWRGSGYVRWQHETNRGFLRALSGLQQMAAEIGERDEDERCMHFLHQLDPAWPPAEG